MPPNMPASSGRRSGAARSASRRSAWTGPAIPITRSAPTGSTMRRSKPSPRHYRLFAPIARDWARLAFEHPAWGVAKGTDGADQSTTSRPLAGHRPVRPVAIRRARLDLDRDPAQPQCGAPRRRRRRAPARARRVPGRRLGRPHPLRTVRRGRRQHAVAERRGRHLRRGRMADAPPLERRPDRLWPQPYQPRAAPGATWSYR